MVVGVVSSLILFLLYLPLVLGINFYQNDDWVYYKNVQNFLSGDFTLHTVTAPTFYVQGFIGMFFSKIFGISHLPVLTLVFSVLNFLLSYIIVYKFLNKGKLLGFLVAAIVFLNPWHGYSILGFMTENYFLTFYLLSIIFFLLNEKNQSKLYTILMFLTIFIGFNVRQVSLVFVISLILFYAINKKYELALSGALFIVFNVLYYIFLFPRTPEMFEKSLMFHHILKFDYSYAIVYGSFLMLSACLLPLLFPDYKNIILKENKLKTAIWVFLCLVIFLTLNHFFIPGSVSWGEFPFFENTWERTGYFPRNIIGTRYYFRGIFDLYLYWGLATQILFASYLSYFLLFIKKFNNFFLINCFIYLGVMVLTTTFFDRYLLYLMPTAAFFLISTTKEFSVFHKLSIGFFVVFLLTLTYQFSNEFVLRNNYIWNKATQLVSLNQVLPEDILISTAWSWSAAQPSKTHSYYFSYDNPNIKNNFNCCLNLIEKKNINFPFSLFLDSNIYLYGVK